jgi:hypothetical protein
VAWPPSTSHDPRVALKVLRPELASVIGGPREIVERTPHLVGLQEVTTYTVLDPATFTPIMQLDWLHLLLAHLHAHVRHTSWCSGP